MLNFNHLYYFQTIAKLGSIAKASQVLHLTQSTLSDQLRQLEERLGKKLFDRAPRRLILNEQGRIALGYAERIFSTAEALEKSLQSKQSPRMELIRIGHVPSLVKVHIHEFLGPLWKARDLRIRVIEGGLSYLIKELEVMNLELVLSDVTIQHLGTQLLNRHLISREIVAVAHPRFIQARKDFPKSLSGLPFVNFTEQGHLRNAIDQFLTENEIEPDRVGEVDDIGLARLSAENGVGFVFLPKNAVTESLKLKKLVTLGYASNIKTDMFAITQKSSQTHPRLLKAIREFHLKNKKE